MALSTELYGLKSAGVYRFEKDQSVIQNTVEPLENIRMLVGFSKIGPFNTPVYITNTKEFVDTFGEIDRTLEKRGAYFHRSCLAALSAGPIYALNLLKLNPEDDKVSAMLFSTSATCEMQTKNPETNQFPYIGMYNIDTFYTPSEESFLYTIGRENTYKTDGSTTNCILNFTNIGKTPVSVIVTKSSEYNASAYDVTCQEWYGKGNVPEYLHPTSYISDFFVDVYVLSGEWGGDFGSNVPYERFASDIKFCKYFDKLKGLKRRKNETDTTDTMLAQFLNEPDVQLIGKYTGCLIPGFIDKNGHNLYIEYLINSDTSVNGLMCSVNEEIFDGNVVLDGDMNGIDMVGHSVYDKLYGVDQSVIPNDDVNFLSYSGSLAENIHAGYSETGSGSMSGQYTETGGNITLNCTVTPETIGYAQTGTDSDGWSVNWYYPDSSNHKRAAFCVYYYAEDANGNYLPMESNTETEAKNLYDQISEISKRLSENGNVFISFDAETSLYPVVSFKKTTFSGTIDPENGFIPSIGDYKPATLAANPIVKYTFEIASSDSDITFASGTTQKTTKYILDNDFCKALFYNDTKMIFVEGGHVYNKRASLGDNDYVTTNGTNRYDINWLSPAGAITKIGSYDIMNESYYPDFVIADFGNGNTAQSFIDHTGYILDDGTFSGIQEGIYVILGANNFNTSITVIKPDDAGVAINDNEFIIPVDSEDMASYKNVKVGNYALAYNGCDDNGKPLHRLTRIVSIEGIRNPQTGVVEYRLVKCQDKVAYTDNANTRIEVFNKFTNAFTNYNIFTLSGFSLKPETHLPDGTEARQHEILDLLDENSNVCNLYKALVDREIIQFRYLVDTFGLGIESMCKSQYTRLCQGRKSAFAIINMPSVNDFKNSQDPSFVDKNGSVSAEFIAKGANPDTNPSFRFSLPDIVNGSTWGAYYYPYLKVYSNYTTLTVPPAAYVSNNFVAKYGAGSPWTLVAGQNRGVISGNSVVGVETSLVRDNRDWLEPAGINSIIYQNNIGCVIYANKTAKQTPKSALSSINCREACIYIQDGVEKILRNYLFETNTAQTRLEIKTLVDNFLDMVKNNGGVYDYKTVMDSSNNDAEVIDHNMGVIDIFIEPVRGLEILVQKLTILRTGAIESGTFE